MSPKLKILFLIFSASLLSYSNQNALQSGQPRAYVDSLKNDIKENGFSEGNSNSYLFYLINNPIDISEENKFIDGLTFKNNLDYLPRIILLKKGGQYLKAFDLAFQNLKNIPQNYFYYEELVWLAGAAGKISVLQEHIAIYHTENFYLTFLSGFLKFKQNNFADAKNVFESLIKKRKNKEVYFWLSYTNRYLGDYQAAFTNIKRVIELAGSSDHYFEKALNAAGGLYYLSGDYEKAGKNYQSAFEAASTSGNNIELIKAFINQAIIDDEAGEIYEARNKLSAALLLAEEIQAIDLQAISHSELGVSFTYDTQLIKAEEHYLEALAIYEDIKETIRLPMLYNNLGKIYMSQFNYKFALEYFKKGLNSAGENLRAQILNLTQIADVYANLSNYSEALKYYKSAHELSNKIKEVNLQVDIELGFGMLEFNLGKFYNSLNYFRTAEKLASGIDSPYQLADAKHKIGLAYTEIDSLVLAVNYLKEAESIYNTYQDIYSRLLVEYDLAYLYIGSGEHKKAREILRKTIQTVKEYELNYLLSLNYLFEADIYETEKKYNNALSRLSDAVNLGEQIKKESVVIEALHSTAKIYSYQNKFEETEAYYRKVMDRIERNSFSLMGNAGTQISYFASYDEVYEEIIEFYLNQNRNEKAFEVLDISRSRNTLQNIANLKIISQVGDEELLKSIFRLNWQVGSGLYSKEEEDSIKESLTQLNYKISEMRPGLKKYLYPNKPVGLKILQKALDESTLFVSINAGSESTQVYLVNNNSFQYYRQNISSKQILNLLKEISPYYSAEKFDDELIFNHDLFSFNVKKAHELYNALFDSISEIKHAEKMIFSVSEELLNFPIESLVVQFSEEASPFNFDNVKFLIEDFSVTYAPSLGIYAELQNRQINTEMTNLLIGDPIVSNNEFYINYRSSLFRNEGELNQVKLNPLEFSKAEINAINSIVGSSTNFTSEDATEFNFKKYAPESNLIHISSHSLLLNDQPFIVFTENGKSQDNGFLEAGEILQLKLNSDLVVLSSCKSGLGEIDRREGILGMQKSFFDAGAKSVVVSLWDVNDKFTYFFMELFYENLKSGLSKSASLQKAKVDFIERYSSNPYYWAAFVLSGSTKKINLGTNDVPFIKYILAAVILVIIIFLTERRFALYRA